MDEKNASLLRFAILGIATAAHHYALTPPSHSSPEEKALIEGGGPLKEKNAVVVEQIKNKTSGERFEGVLHENDVSLLRLGLNLCSWSRYVVWGLTVLEGAARVLSIFPTSEVSTIVLPILLPSFTTVHPQAFLLATSNAFFLLNSGSNLTFLLSAAAVVAGASIRGICFNTLKRLYTFSHTTLKGHTLVKTGPYAIVRHPGYVGTVLVRGGMISLLLSSGSLADAIGGFSLKTLPLFQFPWTFESAGGILSAVLRVSVGLYSGYAISEQIWLLSRSWREDETLHKQFGAEWEEYRRNVPSRFIPFII